MAKRRPDQMRATTIEPYPTAAPGSVMITVGRTQVLCTASIAEELPKWLAGSPGKPPQRGWVTGEYAMLPGSTPQRKRRGGDGRATEIQRLIGRTLRAAVSLERMPGVMITCDCDVIVADGGTRTAAATGAFVALAQALAHARRERLVPKNPLLGPVAAVSVGIVDGRPRLDLDYELDSRADVDMNVAMNHLGRFVEVQGTAEHGTFDQDQLSRLLNLAAMGIRKLMRLQRAALRQIRRV